MNWGTLLRFRTTPHACMIQGRQTIFAQNLVGGVHLPCRKKLNSGSNRICSLVSGTFSPPQELCPSASLHRQKVGALLPNRHTPDTRRTCGTVSAVASSDLIVDTKTKVPGTGVYFILLLNIALFVLDHVCHFPWVSQLYLNHQRPHWWTFITNAFCHASWEHLSGNLFMLYIFGRVVEEEEGALGVWTTYIICAVGGSLASYLTTSLNSVSVGASGAVFGLFAVSVLCKLSFSFRKLLEAAILGQFVLKQLLGEIQAQSAGGLMMGGARIGHMAHLGGALMGVLLVVALSRLPKDSPAK